MKSSVINDGIINPEKWGNAGYPKILFFLKEAYSDDDQLDLCEFLRTKACMEKEMWYNAAAWADLIRDPFCTKDKDLDSLFMTLQHCAVVNIKKEDGKKTSKHSDLKKHFEDEKNQEFLKSQIEAINPDIIVTGGTFRYLKDLIPGVQVHDHGQLQDNIGFYSTSKYSDVIRLRHPSYSEALTVRYYHTLQRRYRKIYETIKKW